jgi:hypothetical protein
MLYNNNCYFFDFQFIRIVQDTVQNEIRKMNLQTKSIGSESNVTAESVKELNIKIALLQK